VSLKQEMLGIGGDCQMLRPIGIAQQELSMMIFLSLRICLSIWTKKSETKEHHNPKAQLYMEFHISYA
jgi:hypothetical protein